MKKFLLILGIFQAIFLTLTAQEKKSATSADVKVLADKIVNQCAGVKEGDMVYVGGNASQMDLLKEISLDVQKKGGSVLLAVSDMDLEHQILKEVPEKYDSKSFEMMKKLMGITTVIIDVESGGDPSIFADIPPERLAARSRAASSFGDLLTQQNIRYVNLGNGMYPSAYNAEKFGLTKDELSDIFWKGVNTDYNILQANGEGVKQVLKEGKLLKITNPNGTSFSVNIEKRPVFVQDGALSEEDLKMGKAAGQIFLPAGEVMLGAVPGTAEGTIVVDRYLFMGKEIEGLTLVFNKGKLVSMKAKSGIEPLQARYDAAGPGKEDFAFVDFGINPDVKLQPGKKFQAWMPAGMLTIGTGPDSFVGGENTSDLSLNFLLPGSTVLVDDNAIVDKGELKINQLGKK